MAKKTTTSKRYLTPAERKSVSKNIQSCASLLYRLKSNERIDGETRGVLRKMHKCLVDAAAYSSKLNFLQ